MTIKAAAAITLSCVVDVWSTTRYYLLQSSTLERPARPTTRPPTGGWDDTEPGYVSGSTNTLYLVDLTVFSDDTWAYSAVSVSSAYEAAKAAYAKAQAAQGAAEGAVEQSQLIYISKAAGTASVSPPAAWVTNASDAQNAWTRKRPTYSAACPVLFVATQRRTVGGAVSCTDPIKDDTTTVIDGGHITTGTIDASKVTVANLNASNITGGVISDGAGKNQWNLNTGALSTQSGSIGDFTLAGGKLSHVDAGDSQKPTVELSGAGLSVSAIDPLLSSVVRRVALSGGQIVFYNNDTAVGSLFYNAQNGGSLQLRYNGSAVLTARAGALGSYFDGTAAKASADDEGNALSSTYLKREPLLKYVSYSATYSIAGSGKLDLTGDDFGIAWPSGYVPLCFRNFSTGNRHVLAVTINAYRTGANNAMQLQNLSSSAYSDVTAYLGVVYIQSGLIQ